MRSPLIHIALIIALVVVADGCSDLGGFGRTDNDADDVGPAIDAAPAVVDATDVADAEARDAEMADAGDGCASPPTGEWNGTTRIFRSGAGSNYEVQADVHWTQVASNACVDRYQPSGTAHYIFHLGCCCQLTIEPGSAVIQPTDGELIIDRTTSPATYRMNGATLWNAVSSCSGNDEPVQVGGTWAENHGAFDHAVISGGIDNVSEVSSWRITRAGTTFTPPGEHCSEASAARWAGTAYVSWGTAVSVTWTRVATTGCVDRFEPMGTANKPSIASSCTSLVYNPDSHQVATTDGVLEIDRSTNPATFRITGSSEWNGTITCTRADGGVESYPGSIGGAWGFFFGAFDGDRFSGGTVGIEPSEFEWSLTRLE